MSRDARLRACYTMEYRADVPLGCRGCTITGGIDCKSCPANPRKNNKPKPEEPKK